MLIMMLLMSVMWAFHDRGHMMNLVSSYCLLQEMNASQYKLRILSGLDI